MPNKTYNLDESPETTAALELANQAAARADLLKAQIDSLIQQRDVLLNATRTCLAAFAQHEQLDPLLAIARDIARQAIKTTTTLIRGAA